MTVILTLFIIFVGLDALGIYILTIIENEERISIIYRTRKIIKTLLLVEINALNFTFAFMPVKYYAELIVVIIFNVIALVYFLLDIFYFTERKIEYILWLQSIVFSKKLTTIFDLKDDDGGVYHEIKRFPKQMCSIIKRGNEKFESIKVKHGKTVIILVPKKPLSRETLVLYCQKFELDMFKKKEVKVYSSDINSLALKEYERTSISPVYLFIKNKVLSRRGKQILFCTLMVIVLSIIILIIVLLELRIDITGWLGSQI